MSYSALYRSPPGDMLVQSDNGESLSRLVFCDADAEAEAPQEPNSSLPLFAEVKSWLDSYFSGNNPPFTPPLFLRGTEFQRAVWKEAMQIPYGKTCTYGEIAARLPGRKGSQCSRAVGAALARNPIAIIVPCHRVIGANGALTGYAGGLERKKALLLHEGWRA